MRNASVLGLLSSVCGALGDRALPFVLALVVGVIALPTFAGGAKHIDFENHFLSTNYLNFVAGRTEPPRYDRTTGVLTLYTFGSVSQVFALFEKGFSDNTMYTDFTDLDDKRLAEMERVGVDMAVISCPFQVDNLPPADALRLAKATNDDIYEATKRHPDRFMGAAQLPTLQVKEACAELERCVKELGFKYWQTCSTIPDQDTKAHHIWEPEFEPLLAKAAELGVCIYLHPEYPFDPDYWDSGTSYPSAGLGFGQDVMQVATHLVMNGTFDRYPNLRIILGHMGEYLPYVLDRMNFHMNIWSKAGAGGDPGNVACEKTLYHYVVTNANFIITTSGAADTNAFQCAKEALGADRICFASDWPLEDYAEMAGIIDKCDLTDAERDGVWSLNAQKYILARKPDYTTADGKDWLFNHAIAGKECPDEAKESDVDLFYVYPTMTGNEQIVIDGFRGIDDAAMRDTATNMTTAVGTYCNTARCFADMAHVYAPFYRQATLDTATDCATNAAGEVVADANAKYLAKLCEGPAYSDVTNALTTYFAKWNKGRKFVLAAHSQGSAILRLVMEKYFTLPENQDKAKRLICSYQIGFGIGQSSVDAITAATGVTFAEKADDTNVIVSYNSMGENTSGNSVLLPSDTLAINPLSWSRSTDHADRNLNLGSLTSAIGTPDVVVPYLYGAQVADTGANRGQVNICKELNGQVLPPNLFGTGSLHAYDYAGYWFNLGANVLQRYAAATDRVYVDPYDFRVEHATYVVKTNGVAALCGSSGAAVVAKDADAVAVYTADRDYVFADGKREVEVALDASASPAKPLSALPEAVLGHVTTKPWLQDVYTNRVTVMCETFGPMDGLAVQAEIAHQTVVVPMVCTNGLKEGTFVYKAQLALEPGERTRFALVKDGIGVPDTDGEVTGWKDEDAAFSCAIWGDNQEGVQEYDWGNDVTAERYRCITNMFAHMASQKPDFGFTTGDLSSSADYDEEILPGELRGANDLFGRTIPYHLVWGNHDCVGTFLTEGYSDAAQRYFAPAASEKDGWFHLYRNDVLFIGVHWTWGQDGAEERYAEIAKGVEELLKTDRAKKAKFRVLVQHAPIFLEVYNVLPKVNWFGDTRLLDVAKAGGVDVVFSGHTHAYERVERDGIVQVVNGGMGYLDHGERWYNNYGSDTKVGGHQNTPLLWARQDSSSLITHHSSLAPAQPVRMGCFQGYGMLSVEGDKLTYRAHAFNADGSYIGVADAFELRSKTVQSVEKVESVEKGVTIGLDLGRPIDNVAWGEYKTAIGEPFEYDPAHAHDPVVNVSKTEIERFCAALNAGTPGANYRLPTLAELTEIFDGNLKRDVSEWTSDIDPISGWCRILGGNKVAVDYTWCREFDKPAMASPDCHANYLGFRVVNAASPIVAETVMDRALAALAAKVAAGEQVAEIYQWSTLKGELKDITKAWTGASWKAGDFDYKTPVIFTGSGDLTYRVREEVVFGGGLAAPNAASLNLSHVLDLEPVSKPVTVKGEFRGGVAADEWRFYLKCDALTLDNVKYRGQVFNAVTDDRTLNLVGTNDFSGAVMSVGLDSLLKDPYELFVTNLVAAQDAMLWLRRLDFTTRGVAEEVLRTLVQTANFAVGENVTLVTSEDVLFGIKGAMLKVDGAVDAAGVDIAGHLLGLLPQEATVTGSGTLTTTHFGMCDSSTLYLGIRDTTLLSSVPRRTYADPASGCNVKWIQRAPDYAAEDGHDWLFHHDIPAKRYEGEPAEDPGVDLFYFYPTSVIVSDDHVVDGVCDIDDPVLRGPDGATNSWNLTAKVFGDFTHVYAPFYRQTPSDVEMPIGEQPNANANMRRYWYEHAPYQDVTNALTHYFTVINPNGERPFIFAGHSHGSGMLSLVMEHFFAENPTRKAWLKNMVACYALGWGVSKDWEKKLNDDLGINVATNATDTGVYVFWNVYGPNTNTIETILYPDPEKSAAAVNPILWTRVATNATADLNLGGWTTNAPSTLVPHLYDASNHVANGTIICTSKDMESQYLAPPRRMFGEHSLHLWDYMLYWANIGANGLNRYATLTDRAYVDPYDFRVEHASFVVQAVESDVLNGPAGAAVVEKGAQAFAVYTAEEGYLFGGKDSTATVALDTSVSPVRPAAGAVLPVARSASVRFERSSYEVLEGGALKVRVCRGEVEEAAQATLSYVRNTGSYSGAYMDGKKVSFPLTLGWEKNDYEPKEIVFQTTASARAEADKTFTLQLSAKVGEVEFLKLAACTVTIKDAQGGAEAKPYVRALAWPANAGTVSGAGALATAKSYRTLSASAKSYATFAGWYRAKADNPDVIDLESPVAPYNARYPRDIRVGYGTDNEAGTYFAYFTNVLAVAAVVEPKAFDDETGAPLPGVAGLRWAVNGLYLTYVGVKFSLPVDFLDDSGKGSLSVTKLPSGLAYNKKTGRIEGVPTKAGLYEVQFVASNAAGKHTVTYTFLVQEIPSDAVGTFYGVVSEGDSERTGVGSVAFTAGKTGSLSAKVTRRLSGTRSFSVKGYDYIDTYTFGVAMTNSYGEVLEATLRLPDPVGDVLLEGVAFGGTRKGTLGANGETNGTFVAVRNAFATGDGDAEAQQVLAAYKGTYGETLYATNGLGVAEEAVGTVQYKVQSNGNVYLAAKVAKTYDGEKAVAAKTLTGTVTGGFRYDSVRGVGGCAAALRNGTYLWSTEALFDYSMRAVTGQARYIRPNAEDKTEVVDADQFVGDGPK